MKTLKAIISLCCVAALGAGIRPALGSQGAAPSRLSAAAVRAVSRHDDRALSSRPCDGRRVVLRLAAGFAPVDELARRSAGDRPLRDAYLCDTHAALFTRPRCTRESRTVHRRGLRGDRELGARRHRTLLCSRRARPASLVAAGNAALGSREPATRPRPPPVRARRFRPVVRVRGDGVQRLSPALPALSLIAGAAA